MSLITDGSTDELKLYGSSACVRDVKRSQQAIAVFAAEYFSAYVLAYGLASERLSAHLVQADIFQHPEIIMIDHRGQRGLFQRCSRGTIVTYSIICTFPRSGS